LKSYFCNLFIVTVGAANRDGKKEGKRTVLVSLLPHGLEMP